MTTATLFRVAALAWLLTSVARVLMGVLETEAMGGTVGVASWLVGAAVGIIAAWLLWSRPGRRTAIITSLLGSGAIVRLSYVPLIGHQPWFVILTTIDIVACVLSLACLVVAWRHAPPAA